MLDFYGRALRSGDTVITMRGRDFAEGVVDIASPEKAWVVWTTEKKSDRHADRSLLRSPSRVVIVETFDGRPCGPA